MTALNNKGVLMSKERIPYRIIITGSYNKDREKVCKMYLEEIEDHARGILVNMGMKEAGKDGVADYNEVKIAIEDPRDIILNKWCVEDVLCVAKDRKVKLTKKQARKILADIDHHHDASIGINWDVIDCHIDMRNW
jgi:hypothetical protein